MRELRIVQGANNYGDNIQGKANEPICVAGLLDRARYGLNFDDIDYPLDAIYDRLHANAPRVAIIGGSLDHPAHVVDWETVLKAAYRIWKIGGVPFYFGIPVVCDGTAQSNAGMCYSLQSRNAVTSMVVNQMEGQSYHGAFVIQGCDKTPMAVLAGLATLDVTRQARGDAHVFATFAPAHVLKGGTIPESLLAELEDAAVKADSMGKPHFAEDIRGTSAYVLQCASAQAFQGIFERMVQESVIDDAERQHFEKYLSVHACDGQGGICSFNGTGNSSRNMMSAFGMVHPSVELLTEPPTQEQIDGAIDPMMLSCADAAFSVGNIVRENIENCVRVFAATGGSTNLVMHLVAAMAHAGVRFDLGDYEQILYSHPVPDIFDYSLTEGRDIYALAQQCCDGDIRGMETVLYELMRNDIPVHLDAPTVTGTSWRERLSDTSNLSADGVSKNPVILSKPRRPFSGVDVLKGNFIESAVVKISGMKSSQIDEFDGKAHFVLYYENEEEATEALLNVALLDDLRDGEAFPREDLLAMADHNSTPEDTAGEAAEALDYDGLFDAMAKERTLKLAIFISGQGPVAFGMPEQFTPTQYINHNYALNPLVVLISDGRFSGVSYGAAIGHVTPEAAAEGDILYLMTGDLLHIRLRDRRLDLIDRDAFHAGRVEPATSDLASERGALGEERLARIRKRRRVIAPTNVMLDVTDAARGVIPQAVAELATDPYRFKG